jgi:MscS family membrane protein
MNISSLTVILGSLGWYYKVLFAFIGTALVNYFVSMSIAKLHKFYLKHDHPIKDIIIISLKPSLHFFIITLGLTVIAHILIAEFKLGFAKSINNARFILIVVSIVWFLMRLINKIEHHLSNNIKSIDVKIDKTSLGAIAKIARIVIFIIAILICMEHLGFSISGILAFGGVSGVIMGFASKDILANFLGAATIYLDKPFKVGDWVNLREKSIEGHIEKIGLRCTVIRSLDKRPIYVPNSIFSLVAIENASQMSHRPIREILGIRHEDFSVLEEILYDIQFMISNHPDIDSKQTCSVNFTGFTPTSLDITIMCFSKSVDYTSYSAVKESILTNATSIIIKHNARISQITNIQIPTKN